jgi:phosphoesterase RecJ-like protein
MTEELQEIQALLAVPKSIAIIAHRNPDGDALGASLAMQAYLEDKGHVVKVVMPSESPQTFKYLPNFGRVVVFDLEHDKARGILDNAEVIFLSRL